MKTEQELREAFEVWFRDNPLTVVGVFHDGAGYTKESLEWAFQAGHALQAEETEALKQQVRELVDEIEQTIMTTQNMMNGMLQAGILPSELANYAIIITRLESAINQLPEHLKARYRDG